MRRVPSILLVLPAALLVVAAAAPAQAQANRPGRPYRGLFGSGTGDAEQLLTVSGAFGAGFDNDLNANVQGLSTPSTKKPLSGGLGNLSGALGYSMRRDSISLTTVASTSGRYYPSESSFVRSSDGRASFSAGLGERTSISAAGSVTQQPYDFSSVFASVVGPVSPLPGVPDLGTVVPVAPDNYRLATTANAGISHRLSKRTSLNADYGYSSAGDSGAGSTGAGSIGSVGRFVSHSGGGGLTYQIARGIGLRAGYHYAEARYGTSPEPVVTQAIDAGLDYSRTLSFSRRTALSFSTGSAATRSEGGTHLRATGQATLQHEIGRSWMASAGYSRGVTLNESWREPVMSDSAAFTFGGMISRRIEFSSILQGALGSVGTAKNAGTFDNYYATSNLSLALSRFMSAGVSYSYYHHRFDESIVLPAGAAPLSERQSVSANVSLWAPLLQRSRRPNAPR